VTTKMFGLERKFPGFTRMQARTQLYTHKNATTRAPHIHSSS